MFTIGEKAAVLTEALPWISRSEGKILVIKYGGAAMLEEHLRDAVAQDIVLLQKIGVQIVIVHGGGKEITALADRLGLPSRFVRGQRVTDAPMMEVVQMVLAGKTNKEIVGRIGRHDGEAAGLCGVDGGLFSVEPLREEEDLGLVGRIVSVNTDFLTMLLQHRIIPVIAPIGAGKDGVVYNVNADIAASAVAGALKAEKLMYMSDVEGIVADGDLVSTISARRSEELIRSGVIGAGMIPKVRSAFEALRAGVRTVHLIDGRVQHSLLLEIFTDCGIGTQLVHDEQTAL
jgi:acetylglutamate kinase